MNPFPLPAKSASYGGARHITEIDWRSKGLSDADEEVAAILLQLPRLISDSNSLFIWGGKKKKRQVRKRRRYVVIKKDPATSFSTEEPSTSKQFESASSPDTPLISSFSPAATNNSKLLPKRKPVKRRRRENELLLVTQLEKERDLLRTKIENMRQQKDRAMAINTLLKRQQELIGGNHHHHQDKEKDAKLGEVNTSLTLGMQWQWTQPPSIVLSCSSSSVAATVNRHGGIGTMVQQQPLIGNRTAVVADKSRGFLSVKLGVGPQKLIDLNLPADGCHVLRSPQPLDPHVDKKVMATLARQKRCAIYKATRRNLVKGILRY